MLRNLHFQKDKKEQEKARRSKREGEKITTHFTDYFALTPDFPSCISLLLQPRDLILFLSLDSYVPEILKLEMLRGQSIAS